MVLPYASVSQILGRVPKGRDMMLKSAFDPLEEICLYNLYE